MRGRARLNAIARADLRQAVLWIARDNRAAADRLVMRVDEALRLLTDHPLIGRERPELVGPPFRVVPVNEFPYLLIYNPGRRPVVVLRVLHSSRDILQITAGNSV